MPKCVGCRACELICSYHHRKVFWPSIASIKVTNLGKGKYSVRVFGENHGKRIKCDNCEGEDFPLCVEICPAEVICLSPRGIEVVQI
ncbi:MAG: hypothetical protein APU95_02465 [Hadesarchaea archaeon YNP_N21]|jgi:Fe-S-cluster-containing dehydrogenase component|nr:MAG: hypothetical protein APU95_02465 [Hadesarchaea archaeon YNP_N21]